MDANHKGATDKNRILSSLSDDRLTSALEWTDLPARMSLVESEVDTDFVYFLESGLASVVVTSRGGDQRIEVGHIGFEGMTGSHVVMGLDRTPMQTFMQVSGAGWRLPAPVLRERVASDAALRTTLLRYVQTCQLQLAHSALANGRYTIPQRLARWLLMCHDRLGTDTMPLTHEFLALMLGVRRSGVTTEIHILEGEHIIRATRGLIVVRDRARLEALAGETYGTPEAEYEKLFGRFRAAGRDAVRESAMGKGAGGEGAAASLAGRRVLIVEDAFHLALQMARHLRAEGVAVVGPAPSVQEALRLLVATPDLDAALVDVNLRGEMSFPLAEALRKRGVPFIFLSGYDRALIPSHLSDVDFYYKPVEPNALSAALLAVA